METELSWLQTGQTHGVLSQRGSWKPELADIRPSPEKHLSFRRERGCVVASALHIAAWFIF